MADEKQEKVLKDVPWYRSARIMLALVSAWGYVFFYVLRIDLSLAIVCMMKDPHQVWNGSTSDNSTHWYRNDSEFNRSFTDLAVKQCGDTGRSGKKSYKGEFTWSKELRGYILSSFFYGYIFTQVPGGWLANRFGGKHVFGGGVLVTIIATMLVPVAARASPYLLILLRIVMGLGCGVGFPATHHLYGMWVPPLERSRIMTFSYAGTMIGTILALFISGFLCDIQADNGWPLIFYVYGGISFVWWILWNIFVYDSPLTHPRIDPVEREYIVSTIGPAVYGKSTNEQSSTHTPASIPWLRIMRSPPVWAIITAHSCNNWANYTILVCMPMYMKEVLKFDIKQNAALSSLPYVFSYFAAIGSGQLADFLISRRILDTTKTRKLFQSVATAIPAVLLVSMGYTDCDTRNIAVILLCLTVGINSCCRAGFIVNHVDISPRHAGILFGISNTAATIPGILAPIAVGLLTTNGTQLEWQSVFYICGALYVFSTVVYIILGDGKPQRWSTNEDLQTTTTISTSKF